MTQDLVIFGAGKMAQCMAYYFEREGHFRVAAFSCDREYMSGDTFLGRPLVASDELAGRYPPGRHAMFVALGYQQVNRLRMEKYRLMKSQGYRLVSYISPHVRGVFTHGDNCAILDDVAIQPYAEFGSNVFVWGGAMIGHHARIGDHCWVTGSAAVGGSVNLGEGCFVGLNATVGQEVQVGAWSILGANSLTTRNLEEGSVVVVRDTEPHRLKTAQFTRLTRCFG